MTTVSTAELARRVRTTRRVQISASMAAMFVGYWIEHGIVVEEFPGQYRLTDHGLQVASGLIEIEVEVVA